MVLATVAQPLTDLWQDDEYYWRTVLKKNDQTIFVGYLSSEGPYEDYNSDKWELTLESIGPLGVLNDLAYVQPNGNPFVGNQSIIETISNALARGFSDTAHELPIRAYTDIKAENQPTTTGTTFINYSNIDQDMYVSEDGESYSECLDVLKGILSSINCNIFQHEGYWYIAPPHVLANSDSLTFNEYDNLGAYTGTHLQSGMILDIGVESDATGYYHCNINQRLEMRRSVDVFTVRNDHVADLQVMSNAFMEFPSGEPSGANVWERKSAVGTVDFLDPGLKIYGTTNDAPPLGYPTRVLAAESPDIDILLGEVLSVDLRVQDNNDSSFDFQYQIELTGDSTTYYFSFAGQSWQTTEVDRFMNRYYLDNKPFQFDLLPVPENGTIKIKFFKPYYDSSPTTKSVTVNRASFKTQSELLTAAVETKFKKTTPKKEKAKEVENITFNTGDNARLRNLLVDPSDNLIGHITSATSPSLGPMSLSYYCVYNRALYQQQKAKVFYGSVFGHVPLLGAKNYLNIDDRMMPLEWSYDTQANITYMKCARLFYNFPIVGTITEETVYRETIKPTIVS